MRVLGRPARQVLAIGLGQMLAWGSTTYITAVVAAPVGRDLGLSVGLFFAAFSVSLGVMALVGPAIGRRIDRRGGRGVMALSSLVMAAGLGLLSLATGAPLLFAAWCVLGIGMGLGQYDAAFASLVYEHGRAASRMIVGVTLLGGFASTLAWPLSTWIVEHGGWRLCCQAWAAMHLLIGVPLHLRFVGRVRQPPVGDGAAGAPAAGAPSPARPTSDLVRLAVFAGATAFVTSALAVHLPTLLVAAGSTPAQALLAGVLLGPAQVAARFAEFAIGQRYGLHPLLTARVATVLHPIACLLLAGLTGWPFVGAAFAMIHGAGTGMISVARGVLPLALFGPAGYGAITGRLAVAARVMQALAPFVFALVLESHGAWAALGLSGTLASAAAWALWRLRR